MAGRLPEAAVLIASHASLARVSCLCQVYQRSPVANGSILLRCRSGSRFWQVSPRRSVSPGLADVPPRLDGPQPTSYCLSDAGGLASRRDPLAVGSQLETSSRLGALDDAVDPVAERSASYCNLCCVRRCFRPDARSTSSAINHPLGLSGSETIFTVLAWVVTEGSHR